jgi:hypothetical protein
MMALTAPLPWWFDEARRAELKAKWTPELEAIVQGLVYTEVVDGTDPDHIMAQGELLDDPAVLVSRLQRLRERVDDWIRHFDPPNQGGDPPRDPILRSTS